MATTESESFLSRISKNPTFSAVISGTFLLIVGLVIASWPSIKLQLWGAFPEADDDEILIVVIPFRYSEGVTENLPHREIKVAIEKKVAELGLSNAIRVEELPTSLRADYKERAKEIKEEYNASLIIWGDVTEVATTVSYLGTEIDQTIKEIGANSMMAQLSHVAVQEYAQFITRRLPSQSTFFALFAIAITYSAEGNTRIAFRSLRKGIASLPEEYEIDGLSHAYVHLGKLYTEKHEWKHARKNFSIAISLDSTNAWAYHNRGGAYIQLGDFRKALQDFDVALKLDSTALFLVSQGIAQSVSGDSAGARASFDTALTLDPNDAYAYNMRGVFRATHGDARGALDDYKNAIDISPQYVAAYRNLGLAYGRLEQFTEAIEVFSETIEIEPNAPQLWNSRGLARKKSGNLEGALVDFRKAVHIDSTFANVYTNLGNAYLESRRWNKALAAYSKAIAFKPENPRTWRNRGTAHLILRNLYKAEEDFTQRLLHN